jgi:hypothetical protein
LNLPPLGRYSLAENAAAALGIFNALLGTWNPEQAVLCEGGIDWDDGRLAPEREPLAIRTKS